MPNTRRRWEGCVYTRLYYNSSLDITVLPNRDAQCLAIRKRRAVLETSFCGHNVVVRLTRPFFEHLLYRQATFRALIVTDLQRCG